VAGSNTGGQSFSQWYYGAVSPPQPGSVLGSMPPQPWMRSVLDARRSAYNRTPEAEYPDGYL
jgi:hypothetical protein